MSGEQTDSESYCSRGNEEDIPFSPLKDQNSSEDEIPTFPTEKLDLEERREMQICAIQTRFKNKKFKVPARSERILKRKHFGSYEADSSDQLTIGECWKIT